MLIMLYWLPAKQLKTFVIKLGHEMWFIPFLFLENVRSMWDRKHWQHIIVCLFGVTTTQFEWQSLQQLEHEKM